MNGRAEGPLRAAGRNRLLASFVIGVLASGCSSVWVRGVVETAGDQPIASATITLLPEGSGGPSFINSSEPNGCFDLYKTIRRDQDGYRMVIESPGYKPVNIPVAIRTDYLLLVTLEPAGSPRPSRVRPMSYSERYVRYTGPCDPEVKANSISLHR